MRFINHYQCPRCRKIWTDTWDATCDDDCPHCGMRHITPLYSEDAPVTRVPRKAGTAGRAKNRDRPV